MELLVYWRDFAAQSEYPRRMGLVNRLPQAGERRFENERISLIWGGRELSPEAYLAVPTYLRRGLRPGA
jgi:hypothetical protein